jgi:hypothetical protein
MQEDRVFCLNVGLDLDHLSPASRNTNTAERGKFRHRLFFAAVILAARSVGSDRLERLNRVLKNSSFVSGHRFSDAVNSLN